MDSHSDALIAAICRCGVVMKREVMSWRACRSSGPGCTGRRMAMIVDTVKEGRRTSLMALLMSYVKEEGFRCSMEDA